MTSDIIKSIFCFRSSYHFIKASIIIMVQLEDRNVTSALIGQLTYSICHLIFGDYITNARVSNKLVYITGCFPSSIALTFNFPTSLCLMAPY